MNRPGEVRLDQGTESPLQVVRGSAFRCRYAYARSADSRRDNEPGQDYLAFRDLGNVFVFAACDGVSQSFYGNLAARFLGDELVDWLAEYAPAPDDANTAAAALAHFLSGLTTKATALVSEQSVPTEPAILHDVLLEKRSRGSETMFVCGRIELENAQPPEGRILLAWMGDMRVNLWLGNQRVALGGRHETNERWSSRLGPLGGEAHIYSHSLSAAEPFSRLIVYSDGLKTLDETVDQGHSHRSLEEMIQAANGSPESDDVTYFELRILPPSSPTAQALEADRRPPGVAVRPPETAPTPPAAAEPAPAKPVIAPPTATTPILARPAAKRRSSWILGLLSGVLFISLCAIVWLAMDSPPGGWLSFFTGMGGTATVAPVASANATLLPTDVPTSTPIATLTSTPIATLTSTPTATLTSTPTATLTSTPTATPTETPTVGAVGASALPVITGSR